MRKTFGKKVLSVVLTLMMAMSVVVVMPETAQAATKDEAIKWVEGRYGKAIDVDGVYGAQCVDLVMAYYDYLVGYHVAGYGADYWSNSLPDGWSRIPNTPEFIPQPGDIAVWDRMPVNDYNGHVAIVVSATLTTCRTMAQNVLGATPVSNGGTVATYVNDSYSGFLGVIRPSFTNTSSSSPINKSISEKAVGSQLVRGQELRQGECLISNNRKFTAVMQNDGNFVVYNTEKYLFATDTYGSSGVRFVLQNDGNIVVYAGDGRAMWSPIVSTIDKLIMQDDGNLVGYTNSGKAVWNSNTVNNGTGVFTAAGKSPSSIPFATKADDLGDDFYALILKNSNVLTNDGNTTKFLPEKYDKSQIMRFQRNSDDSTYCITTMSDNKAIDVERGNEQGSRVYFSALHKGDNQRFRIEQNGGQYMFGIKSGPQLVWDAEGGRGKFSDGTQIGAYMSNKSNAQWYEIRKIDDINSYLNPVQQQPDTGTEPEQLASPETPGTVTETPIITPAPENNTYEAEGVQNGIKLKAIVTQIGVSFDWTPSNNALGYRIYRSTTPGSEGISISDFPLEGSSFFDANVEPDTQYYYTIAKVESEASFDQSTVDLIPEQTGPRGEELPVLTTFITPNESEKRGFIMMTIGSPEMIVNEETLEIDPGRATAPLITNGRTMVPIKAIVEAIGGTVGWDDADRRITLDYGSNSLNMWLERKDYTSNGEQKALDIAPYINNGRSFFPLKFVAENIGCEIEWIGSEKRVVIVYDMSVSSAAV